MSFVLGKRSLDNLKGVNPDLVKVVEKAISISTIDFTVVEGCRTLEKQKQNVAKGVSKTLNSYHIPDSSGYGRAVDLYPYYDGKTQIPDASSKLWSEINEAMQSAAKTQGVKITWGGSWASFRDCPHFQIEKK